MREATKIYDLLEKELDAYPASNISLKGLSLIAERLDKRYSYEQVERAMNRLSYKAKFFPSLAEIVENIQENEPARVPTPKEQAEQHRKQVEWENRYIAMLKEHEDGKLG